METLYSVIRSKGSLGAILLLPYTSLEEAKKFMVKKDLKKVSEKVFKAHRLVQWWVN
jgi:hypothetical protein